VATATAKSSLTVLWLAATAMTLKAAAATLKLQPWSQQEGRWRRQSRRPRPREQPRLWRLIGRLRHPPED
jgi:hypothetical protein